MITTDYEIKSYAKYMINRDDADYVLGLTYDSFFNIANGTNTRREVTKLSGFIKKRTDKEVVQKVWELFDNIWGNGNFNKEEYLRNEKLYIEMTLEKAIATYNEELMKHFTL